MNRFIYISALPLVVLAAVALTACDQGETPAKRPPGVEQTIEGTWFLGEWRNNQAESESPPVFHLSADRLQWGDCSAGIGGLVSHDEKQAFLAVTKGSSCPTGSRGLLRHIALLRKGDCEVSVELYSSAEAIKRGTPEQSGVYAKIGCNPLQAH